MKCLIVEDNRQDYQLLSRMLMNYGNSDFAENGIDAFEIFKQAQVAEEPYDVIFLDIMMPGIDGIQTLELIRKYEGKQEFKSLKPSKILMISALDENAYVIKSLKFGCDGYIVKPIEKYNLLSHLNRLGLLTGNKWDRLYERKNLTSS